MEEGYQKQFEEFWDRINTAKFNIRNYYGVPVCYAVPDNVQEYYDDSWPELYEKIKPCLMSFVKKRLFSSPPEMLGNVTFKAETAHQALMFILNPPEALYGRAALLDSDYVLQIEEEALKEFKHVKKVLYHECLPEWKKDDLTLWFGNNKILQIARSDAFNQIAILDAFENAGWSERIDDPLLDNVGNEFRGGTAQAIQGLNKKTSLISFKCIKDLKSIKWDLRRPR